MINVYCLGIIYIYMIYVIFRDIFVYMIIRFRYI